MNSNPPTDLVWNPKELHKRPVVQLWPDKFLRLDSVARTGPAPCSPSAIDIYLGYSVLKSKPPIVETYEWDEWLTKAKAWNEWERHSKFGYEIGFPTAGWTYDIHTGETWTVRGRDWIESLDQAIAWKDEGPPVLPWLDITFFDDEGADRLTKRVTIRAGPIPIVSRWSRGDPRHVHPLGPPTDQIQWEPRLPDDQDIEIAAQRLGFSSEKMKMLSVASVEQRREQHRDAPAADAVPLSSRYEELREAHDGCDGNPSV